MKVFSEADNFFMLKALELSRSVKGKTFPNPAVGAVVVNDGIITGRGATQVWGSSHAEKIALIQAGEKALNATLYVTLEPCCHHGRTPPCTDAIVAAGIRKVVICVKDPNPLVAGKGIKALKKHGLEVSVGLLRRDAALVNEDFFWSVTQRKSWVTLKMALTLDGRIADVRGDSKWITTEASRKFVHELRRNHAAIAVGKSTLEKDDPRLTVRHKKGFSPARIIFSSLQNIPLESYFFRHAHESRSIVVSPGGRSRNIRVNSGIEFWQTGEKDPRAGLEAFLEMAFEQNITSILVEGGQKIASEFLECKLVNRVYLFYGNKIFGKGKECFAFNGGLTVHGCISLSDLQYKLIGSEFLVSGIPCYS